jgi:hypothetical protein
MFFALAALAQVGTAPDRVVVPVAVEPTPDGLAWHLTELQRWRDRVRPGKFVIAPSEELAAQVAEFAARSAGLPDVARPEDAPEVISAQLESLFFLANWAAAAGRSNAGVFEAGRDTVVYGLPGGPLLHALDRTPLADLPLYSRVPADALVADLARQGVAVNRWLSAVDQALPASEAPVIRGVQPAVARLLGDGAGTGVNLRHDGLVLTNAHVAGHLGATLTVELPDGYPFRGTCVAIDPVFDLALVDIDGVNLPVARLADAPPALGSRVISVGNPGVNGGVPFRVDTGTIQSFAPDRLGPQERGATAHDIDTGWGHSGSPLFDSQGRIVALHNSYDPKTYMRYAVSWEAMRVFLARTSAHEP